MDALWQEIDDHVRIKSSSSYRFIVPNNLQHLADAVSYSHLSNHSSNDFNGLVIHKGLYKEINPDILFELLRRFVPTLANEVFIILEASGSPLRLNHKHLGMLTEIREWVATNVDSAVRQKEKPDALENGLTGASDALLTLMVNFIVENLVKSADPTQADPIVAIAETAERFNDTAWFWTDDTGKTAELFSVPSVRDAHPALADATLDYILRLSPEQIIHRRSAVPDLKLVKDNPKDFLAYNSFLNFSGDLSRGIVCPSIRFNDDRTRVAAEFSGNQIEFTFRLRRQTVDIENNIVRWSIDPKADRIDFSHTSSINGSPRFGKSVHVCDVTYTYSLWRDRTTLTVTASVQVAPGIVLSNCRITTAFDQLSRTNAFDTAIVGNGPHFQTCSTKPESRMVLATGRADYVSLFESFEIPGFAMGLHVGIQDGDCLQEIIAEGSSARQFHWVYARYRLKTIGSGQTREIVENRMLTGGGYYDRPEIYRQIITGVENANAHIDPSMSYDIGAELNAVATTILFAKRGLYSVSPLSEERIEVLKSWFDRHIDIYLSVVNPGTPGERSRVFVRGLSFIILSLDCMARAFEHGSYRSKLTICVQLMLRLEVPIPGEVDQSLFSINTPDDSAPPQLDCHCAAILALARAVYWGDPEERLSAAIGRGLRAIQIVTTNAAQYDAPNLMYATLRIRKQASGGPQDTGFWNYKLGLALRAFNAVRLAQDLALLSLDPNTADYLIRLMDQAHASLRSSLRLEGGTLEVLTSQRSQETNSETQPWVALGLVPAIEREIFGRSLEASSPEDLLVPQPHALPRGAHFDFDKMSPPITVEWKCSEQQAPRLLTRVARLWEELGESKPHWSVLTSDEFLPDQIAKAGEASFFSSGQHDRNRLLATIARAGRELAEFKVACEFGCGLGRITNHLAENFERVIACDISRPHLRLARAHSLASGKVNITYRVSTLPQFGMTEPFDLWFSVIVLQHNPPPIMAMILRRALKLLRPGGLAIFQVPTYAPDYHFNLDDYLRSTPPLSGVEMHYLPQSALFEIVDEAGGRVVELVEDGSIDFPRAFSNVVVVTKK